VEPVLEYIPEYFSLLRRKRTKKGYLSIMDTSLRILFIGPQWHGSDSTGLARAFRRLGHIVQTVDPDVFFPSGKSFSLKVVRKCFRPLFRKVFNNQLKGWHHFKIFIKDMFIFLIGAAMLLLSAEGVVFSASKLAETFNLSLIVIGASLVALGTSLPEIAFEIRAIRMGHKTMILGGIMGSVVINATLVLGLVGVISPFAITDFSPYLIGAAFTLAACLFFINFARSERKVTEIEALFLLGIYVLFIVAELYFR